MSDRKKDEVDSLEEAARNNEERQRKEQLMASALHKMNSDQILSSDDIDSVSRSGIVSVAKASSIPEAIVSSFVNPPKPQDENSEDRSSQDQPPKPYEESSKVFEAFGNQYWD